MANFGTKEQILASRSKKRTAIVDLPELGYSVIIIELSGKERDAFEASLMLQDKKGQNARVNLLNVRAKLVARTVVDPSDFEIEEHNGVAISATLKDGAKPRRMFNDLEANDLGDISGSALQRVFEASQHLSGITQDDVDELVGELKNDQSADTGIS